MRPFRFKRRPGNVPMTGEVLAFVMVAKEGPCMACVVRAKQNLMVEERIVYGCDWNHTKSGNIRRGHEFGFALCKWHHQRHPIVHESVLATLTIYGPSLMDGGKLFAAAYGGDDYLIELQKQHTGARL